jgi:hypothetical protein
VAFSSRSPCKFAIQSFLNSSASLFDPPFNSLSISILPTQPFFQFTKYRRSSKPRHLDSLRSSCEFTNQKPSEQSSLSLITAFTSDHRSVRHAIIKIKNSKQTPNLSRLGAFVADHKVRTEEVKVRGNAHWLLNGSLRDNSSMTPIVVWKTRTTLGAITAAINVLVLALTFPKRRLIKSRDRSYRT